MSVKNVNLFPQVVSDVLEKRESLHCLRCCAMVDVHDKETRSRNMSRIRSRDTKPELAVRKLLFRNGYRYRLHVKQLPGRPDIVLSKHRLAVFVHGCFWHRHGCRKSQLPVQNSGYWIGKLANNVRKDESNIKQLKETGWKVLVFWECTLKDERSILRIVQKAIRKV